MKRKEQIAAALWILPLLTLPSPAEMTQAERIYFARHHYEAMPYPELFGPEEPPPWSLRKRIDPEWDDPVDSLDLRGDPDRPNPIAPPGLDALRRVQALLRSRLDDPSNGWEALFAPPFPQYGYHDWSEMEWQTETDFNGDKYPVQGPKLVRIPEWTAGWYLSWALSYGMTNELEELESRDPDKFAAAFHAGAFLYQVVRFGNREALRWVEERNLDDVSAMGLDRRSVLYGAVESGDRLLVRHVLARYGDGLVNLPTGVGYTPLMLAARGDFFARNAGLVVLLLDHGANPNAAIPSTGETALHLACLRSSEADPGIETTLSIVRLLLERGADPSVEDAEGRNALAYAKAMRAHPCVVRLLSVRTGGVVRPAPDPASLPPPVRVRPADGGSAFWCHLLPTGEIVLTNRVSFAAPVARTDTFCEGLTPFSNESGKWGFRDNDGLVVFPATYEEVRPFSEGLAPVRTGGRWGYADTDGWVPIPYRYADANPFRRGIAKVVLPDGTTTYINRHGEDLLFPDLSAAPPDVSPSEEVAP